MKHWLCGLATALAAAGAQAADSGTYFKFDVGPNYLGSIHQDFRTSSTERDLTMNIGLRGSVAEGFVLNRFLAVEVEAAALWNELDESNDWLLQVPLLANLVFRYDCKGGWTTYLGVGAGGAGVFANTTSDSILGDDSDLTFVPAWQAMVGLNYSFSENVSIGLVYKYMGIADPTFELETAQGVTQEFRLEDMHNHYGGLQLNYSF